MKGQSSHLVAGFLRSFPQDSWAHVQERDPLKWLRPVKQRIRGSSRGDLHTSTYSRTVNGRGITQPQSCMLLHWCWGLPLPRQFLSPWLLSVFVVARIPPRRNPVWPAAPPCCVGPVGVCAALCSHHSGSPQWGMDHVDWQERLCLCELGDPSKRGTCCQGEQLGLCGPPLVSSAGDAGCSESGLTDPECWLIPRSHKGCPLLGIAGRWP